MNNLQMTSEDIEYILSAEAVRARATTMLSLCKEGKTHFVFNNTKLDASIEPLGQLILARYPDPKAIPFHSRFRHFVVEGHDYLGDYSKHFPLEQLEILAMEIELCLVSVLVDAGAGADWKFKSLNTGKSYGRSEGLALASLELFFSGRLSSHGKPGCVDADGLINFSQQDFEQVFQITSTNPMNGVAGRVKLLSDLGNLIKERPEVFAQNRLGSFGDYVLAQMGAEIFAPKLLTHVLKVFGPIWPSRLTANGINLGDTWAYGCPEDQGPRNVRDLVPFHKLSQWLTYSLAECFSRSNYKLIDVHLLTGLAEYRNGGALIDSGILVARDPELLQQPLPVSHPAIIEWRALTVAILDLLGKEVRRHFSLSEQEFPLAKVLEGGTWAWGRQLAFKRNPNGEAPLKLQLDGTVF